MGDDHFLLLPGGAEARGYGCICATQVSRTTDGPDGEPAPVWRCEPACPIHGLAVAHALFHRR